VEGPPLINLKKGWECQGQGKLSGSEKKLGQKTGDFDQRGVGCRSGVVDLGHKTGKKGTDSCKRGKRVSGKGGGGEKGLERKFFRQKAHSH